MAGALRPAERPAEVLVTACAALGLLERDDAGRYGNNPLARTYLGPRPPEYFGDVVRQDGGGVQDVTLDDVGGVRAVQQCPPWAMTAGSWST